MSGLSHFDDQGASRMVDVSAKAVTLRFARASGRIRMAPATLQLMRDRHISKGDVLEVEASHTTTAIRGTQLKVESGESSDRVSVKEGEVEVRSTTDPGVKETVRVPSATLRRLPFGS